MEPKTLCEDDRNMKGVRVRTGLKQYFSGSKNVPMTKPYNMTEKEFIKICGSVGLKGLSETQETGKKEELRND